MNKEIIRKEILKKRRLLDKNFCLHASHVIFEKLISSNFLNHNNILLYSDFKNEVMTSEVIEYLHSKGINVFLPVCDVKTQTFTVQEVSDKETLLSENVYGIYEPVLKSDDETAEIDCAIVPGIAFDNSCNRIGFGCGYYDKFFELNPDVYKIALAYDFQVLDSVPHDNNDVKMDVIVTEKQIIMI